jgi:NADPH:quinone reductase
VKAISVAKFGGPEELQLADVEPPKPGPGEALVKIARAGINFIDIYMRNGSYARSHTYKTPLPMVIGMEGAGTVAALGSGVTDLAVGDTVAYCLARGSYAEYATVPAWRLSKVPEGVPLPVATTLMLQGCTAHYLTHSAFVLGSDHTCLIHAGAGGVGQLVIQLAKLRGARVLTTVGSADKAEIATALGADACILYRQEDFREKVMQLTDGRGVDVVYDSVGKDTIHRSIRALRRRGVCILFGGSSGQVASIEPLELAEAGSVFFTRPHLADYTASAEEIRSRTADLFKAWKGRKLKVTIDREIPLADAAEAHRILEGRGTRGKLLLQVA